MTRRPGTRFGAPEASPGFLLWRVTLASRGGTRVRRLHLTPAGRDLIARALSDVEETDAAYFRSSRPGTEAFLAALAVLAAVPADDDERRRTA